MSEWWTYRLSDFLLFSPDTYYRLVASWHREIWPAQLAGLAVGMAIVVLVIRGRESSGRPVAVTLAAGLLSVSLGFEWRQFATINWFANYVAVGLAVEAGLILWVGAARDRFRFGAAGPARRLAGFTMLAAGLVVSPGVDLVIGRGVFGAGVFGTMRDPTVLTTLGVILLSGGRATWALLPIPILSCLLSAAMFLAMEAASG